MTNCNYSEHTKIQRKEIQKQIEELQEKLQKLEEIEKQPRMNLQQEGEYAVVSYHDKVYYRLGNKTTFTWYIKKDMVVCYPVPTLMMVNDAETERLLEGLYYNHIQVKKEKVSEEPEDTVWKSVALRFGEKLSGYLSDGYYELSPAAWFRWAVFTYGKGQQKDYKVGVDEPSMINCVILGNPPNGYVAWNEWYNEMGSKGILHNLKISSKEYQPTPQERGERVHKEMEELVRESVKWCEENPDKDPLDWLKPQTPEETAQSLKEAFVKAQQTENWKETQKLIDEEDNDKNFKNSLDLIKEWGEKNKPPTLYQLIENWWCDVFCANSMDDMETCIDGLVNIIDEKFIPPSHDTNGYEWEKCLKMIREKLR